LPNLIPTPHAECSLSIGTGRHKDKFVGIGSTVPTLMHLKNAIVNRNLILKNAPKENNYYDHEK
jgi:hypothetical protein